MKKTVMNLDKNDTIGIKPYYSREDFTSVKSVGLHVQHILIHCDYMPHTHDFNETLIILSGRALHVLGKQEYPLSRGDVYAIKGNTAHGFREVQDLELINLMYDPHIFSHNNYELHSIPGFDPLFLI